MITWITAYNHRAGGEDSENWNSEDIGNIGMEEDVVISGYTAEVEI